MTERNPSRNLEPFLVDQTEQPDGVVFGPFPRLQIYPSEQLDGTRIPTPAQVRRYVEQDLERVGQGRLDREATECFHRGKSLTADG